MVTEFGFGFGLVLFFCMAPNRRPASGRLALIRWVDREKNLFCFWIYKLELKEGFFAFSRINGMVHKRCLKEVVQIWYQNCAGAGPIKLR